MAVKLSLMKSGNIFCAICLCGRDMYRVVIPSAVGMLLVGAAVSAGIQAVMSTPAAPTGVH